MTPEKPNGPPLRAADRPLFLSGPCGTSARRWAATPLLPGFQPGALRLSYTATVLPMLVAWAFVAALASGCCAPTTVRVPVVVRPPPCLTELAPRPPVDTDAPTPWARYHTAMEGWAAKVEASCGAHLTGDQP